MKNIHFAGPAVGYACLSSRKICRGNKDALKTTKAFCDLSTALQFNNCENIPIRIDLVCATYRKRKELELTIEQFQSNVPVSENSALGVILICDMLSLGTKVDEIVKNYQLLLDAKVGLYVLPSPSTLPQHQIFSTVNPETFCFQDSTTLQNLVEKLSQIKLSTRQGRKKSNLAFPENFAAIYWLYETFKISESAALNALSPSDPMPRWKFHLLCDHYEAMDRYEDDWKLWKKIDFALRDDLPKRHGSVPEYFPELIKFINPSDDKASSSNVLTPSETLAQACKELGLPYIFPDLFQRYKIKYETGRAGLLKAAKEVTATETYVRRIFDEFSKKVSPLPSTLVE